MQEAGIGIQPWASDKVMNPDSCLLHPAQKSTCALILNSRGVRIVVGDSQPGRPGPGIVDE
jgi:hypothetical protein